MSDLRSKIIRLAATLPAHGPERTALLAVLKEARGENWKPVVNGDKIRVRMIDHPDNALEIQEMPSKPLKKRLRQRTYQTRYILDKFNDSGWFLMANIVQDAKLSKTMTFEQAADAMDKALDRAKAEILKNEAHKKYPSAYRAYDESWFAGWFPRSLISENEVYFLEVEPHDYMPISFGGKDFSGTSEWGSFRFYADKDEDEGMRQNEGMRTFYKEQTSGGARKLFKFLKADPDAVKNMTYLQLLDFLVKAKIGFDYVPTVWR